MALILAVEPDRQRGRQLAALVGRSTSAEIVVAQSGSAALAALDTRVPDLILTSPVLTPADEAVLRTWLRRLGDAARVQTLTIPAVADLDATPRDGGSIFGRLLDRRDSASESHYAVSEFVDQLTRALDQAAAVPREDTPGPAGDRASTQVWEQELGLDRAAAHAPALWRVSEGLIEQQPAADDGWSRIDPSLPRFQALLKRLEALASR
jgi:hypothetical protein